MHTLHLCCKQRSQIHPNLPPTHFFHDNLYAPQLINHPLKHPIHHFTPQLFVSTTPQTHEILSPKIHVYTTQIGIP